MAQALLLTMMAAGAMLAPAKQQHLTIFVGRLGAVDGYAEKSRTPDLSLSGAHIAPWAVAVTKTRIYSVFEGDYHNGQPGSVTVLRNGDRAGKPIAFIKCGLTTAWAAAVDASGNLLVTDPQDQSVVTFAPSADGCASPLSVLHGPATKLGVATGIAIDFNGRIVTSSGPGNSINVYAPGASGNAPPIASIAGAATGLGEPEGVAVDVDDNIYTTNYGSASVTEYQPYANGDAKPIRTIAGPKTRLRSPIGIAVSPRTGEIYVADYGAGGVLVFAKGAQGDQAPLRVLPSEEPTGVAAE